MLRNGRMNQPSGQLPRWLPTQQAVRQLLAPALVFIVACLDRQFQTDFWMHLARGGEIVASGSFITADHFAIAEGGARVRDANWLSQVFYCRLFSWGGLSLVQVVNALTLSASIWLLGRLCRRNGASWRSAAVAGVITFLIAWQTFLIRPQTFSILLFVLLYAALSHPRRGTLLIWPPLILLMWVNLHGGFLIGLVLIAVFTLASVLPPPTTPSLRYSEGSDRFQNVNRLTPSPGTPGEGRGEGDFEHQRRAMFQITLTPALSQGTGRGSNQPSSKLFIASLLLSAVATLVNPYGWRIYQYAFSLTATVMPRHIEEWLPPPMNQLIGQSLVASALLICGLYLFKRSRPTTREGLLLICFLPLALHSARMVVWWAIVAAPIIASLFDSLQQHQDESQSPSRQSLWMSTTICTILIGLCVLSLPWLEKINPIFTYARSPHRTESDLDQVATSWLDPSRQGRGIIFTRLDWGQYLDWRLGPHERLLMDGHVELASDQAWHDYCQVTSGNPQWERILDRYAVDYLLLDVNYHSTLLSCLSRSKAWEEAFRSGNALLFTRRRAGSLSRGAYLIRTSHPILPTDQTVEPTDGGLCALLAKPSGLTRGEISPFMMDAIARHGSFGGNRQFYGR
jgi:hypothetical protein